MTEISNFIWKNFAKKFFLKKCLPSLHLCSSNIRIASINIILKIFLFFFVYFFQAFFSTYIVTRKAAKIDKFSDFCHWNTASRVKMNMPSRRRIQVTRNKKSSRNIAEIDENLAKKIWNWYFYKKNLIFIDFSLKTSCLISFQHNSLKILLKTNNHYSKTTKIQFPIQISQFCGFTINSTRRWRNIGVSFGGGYMVH